MGSLLNCYATLPALRQAVGILSADTSADADLSGVLQDTSRLIDRTCGRHFYATVGTRVYDATSAYCLEIPNADILSISALATDYDGDGVYEQAWLAADYELGPLENAYASPPEPFWKVQRTYLGQWYFPIGYRYGSRAISITGRFGYFYQLTDSQATASQIVSTSATTFTASSAVPFEAAQTLTLDAEQMTLLAIDATTKVCTVTRGINGTTAALHGAATPIYVHEWPVIADICKKMAHRAYRLDSAPFGVAGSGDLGQQVLTPRDPALKDALMRFSRKLVAA